jgi:hypothetical protein
MTPPYLRRQLERVIDRQTDTSVSRTWPLGMRATRVLADLGLGGRVDMSQPHSVRRAISLIEGEET